MNLFTSVEMSSQPINMCRSCWARKPLIPTRSERVPEEAVTIPPTIRLAAESYLLLMRCVCSIISTLFYLSVGKDPLWISKHGEVTKDIASIAIWDIDPATLPEKEMEETNWELLSDEEMEALFINNQTN